MSDVDLMAAARHYHNIGLNVLPARGKRPLVKSWSEYKKRRYPLWELLAALERPDADSIGIVTGPTSGGVIVRDFDTGDGYERWAAAYPGVAGVLPYERTPRGTHVFARSQEPVRSIKFSDGELRANGLFTIVAPSFHPSGERYKSVRPIVSIDALPPIDLAVFAEMPGSDREARETDDIEIKKPSLSLCQPPHIESIDEILRRTLPHGIGERDGKLFLLARMLKSMSEYANADADALEPILRRWHTLALPFVGTKDWDDTWAKFLHGFKRVRTPIGSGAIDDATAAAFAASSMADVPTRYESEPARKLYALCRELQRRAGRNPFYLAYRTAGVAVGVDLNAAGRLLNRMVAERTLTVAVANTKTRATRYLMAVSIEQTKNA